MLISIPDFRSVWQSLPLSNKIFFLYFCGVSTYTLSLCVYALLHLHSLKKQSGYENAGSAWSPLGILNRRLANLRQLHLLTLYLFGFCIVVNIPNAFVIVVSSKTWPIGAFIQRLTFFLRFDAGIFLGFLLIHSLQWLASVRVDSFVRRRG